MQISKSLMYLGRRSSKYFKGGAAASLSSNIRLRSMVTCGNIANSRTETNAIDEPTWPRKVFSGIQPTGSLHLGNYLGAIKKWKQLQESKDDVTYCIVNMHSITIPQDPTNLSQNILKMAATMLACGIDPEKATLFLQSDVKEHTELCWILGSLTTMARLGHLPQYREKTKAMKEVPLGLYVYPVLQAADIMLYKSTHVPVGEDQVQHIQLTQHLAKLFNGRYGSTFPICHAIIEDKEVSRIRSLRDPTKKMSKSDDDKKATIFVTDEPDEILEKVKKAITDFQSEVTYDLEKRPGVSNLIAIHAHVTNQSIESIIESAKAMDTGKYKLVVAEAIIEYFKPIRESITQHLRHPEALLNVLEQGAEKARSQAQETMFEVKQKMGLSPNYIPNRRQAVQENKVSTEKLSAKIINSKPVQKLSANNNFTNANPININSSLRGRTFTTLASKRFFENNSITIPTSIASFSSSSSELKNSKQPEKPRNRFKVGVISLVVLSLSTGSFLMLFTDYAIRETLQEFFSIKKDGG